MLVLAILAAATWIATWSPQDRSLPPERSADGGPLGYHVRGARLLATDAQGRVTVTIRAERLAEIPNEARLRLEGVSVAYQPPDETAWAITAAGGSTPRDGSLLELSGGVEIRSVPTDGSAPQTILAPTLRFWPETSSVESNAAVQFRVGDWQLRGTGLRTDLKGQTLKLESEVHGTFVTH